MPGTSGRTTAGFISFKREKGIVFTLAAFWTYRMQSLKTRVFDIINDKDNGGKPNSVFDFFIIFLIILNTFIIFIETYPAIYHNYKGFLDLIEQITIVVFTIEYLLRIWTCTCYPEYAHPVTGRLRYACSITMIIDFFAVFPFFLTFIMPLSPQIIHFLRLFRLFRVLKLLRYYGSIDVIYRVIKKDSQYLFSIIVILMVFLSFSSYLIYIFESEAQPEKFQNFDDAFWWAIETTSTVGYGDVVPVTDMGKFFSFLIIIVGIGLIALPTGVIASGFLEELRASKEGTEDQTAPHLADEIRKLKTLLDEGTISEDEFILGKQKILK